MAENNIYLTQAGKEDLEKKLEELKVVKRREVAEKIKVAREFGDISENAEYDAAKEEQAMIEGEILEIENTLRSAVIIEESADTNAVTVGKQVRIYDYEDKVELEYRIVGTTEADLEKNLISNESPVGKALLGKRKGATVSVETPGGLLKFKILDIQQ